MPNKEQKDEVKEAISDVIKSIRRARNFLNYPIMATPTGRNREKITGAEIHLGCAMDDLESLNEHQTKWSENEV